MNETRSASHTVLAGIKNGMPPIANQRATLLILGTLPGDRSLQHQQYYAHPRNAFWPLVAALAGEELPAAYAKRTALIKRQGLALWDVLQSAERPGSLDTAIRNGEPNDFETFFRSYPRISAIAFNGQKARDLFRKFVATDADLIARQLTTLVLPSSSPTHVMPFGAKLESWRSALAPFQNFLVR